MKALDFVNRFGMGIGLVADELKANGNPPAEYIFSEPSSFKVIVKSADPYVNSSDTYGAQDGTHVETQDGTQVKTISRTSVYRLIKSTSGKVKYEGDQYHGEWTVIE